MTVSQKNAMKRYINLERFFRGSQNYKDFLRGRQNYIMKTPL